MINSFYSTIGMMLDIICLTLPILLFFNINFTKRILVYLSLIEQLGGKDD